MELITKSAAETKKVGREFAASLKEEKKKSFTIALIGDLGSGKTTFVQGVAKGLGITQRIISPTFIIMRKYELSNGFSNLYHVDLYRLEGNVEKEVENIGLTDILGKPGNIVLIEWAEKIYDIIPKEAYIINFKNMGKDKRKIVVSKNK